MYSTDEADIVVPLADCPACDVGAPLPMIVAREHFTALAYLAAQAPPPEWHGQSIIAVDAETSQESIVVLIFQTCAESTFGWFPDENTIVNHPLFRRGLESYGAYRIENSSWKRRLMLLESSDVGGREATLARMNHYVFTFHDSTFECISDAYRILLVKGSMSSAVQEMAALMTRP